MLAPTSRMPTEYMERGLPTLALYHREERLVPWKRIANATNESAKSPMSVTNGNVRKPTSATNRSVAKRESYESSTTKNETISRN